ncbi:hypothetical protein B296_00043829 [Ensete ventricosum]|uniref:DUF4408 domain-containing protein n=1 Tax=Ensete ventricosum TaxID=4639 RepID=A0A426YR77_ENSVE|nr:hypothetical protein B296_00043829 [Ensete ventricosum]
MDPVTAEKMAARRRYRRIRRVKTLLRCLEALSAFCLLSWSTARLPAAARLSAGLLRRVAPVLLGPRFVFLLGNAIVIALFAMSGRHPGSAAPSASGGEIHDQFLACESRGIRSHAAGKEKAPRAWRRSRSERMERRRGHRVPELRRSKSEVSCQEVAVAATEKEEKEADAEEFRRTIEAFIAEQLRRFHREESTDAVAASAGTPDTTTATTITTTTISCFGTYCC